MHSGSNLRAKDDGADDAKMDLPNGGGGGGGDYSSEGNGSVTGREQQELWRNANAFNRYESTLGEYRTEVSFKL